MYTRRVGVAMFSCCLVALAASSIQTHRRAPAGPVAGKRMALAGSGAAPKIPENSTVKPRKSLALTLNVYENAHTYQESEAALAARGKRVSCST